MWMARWFRDMQDRLVGIKFAPQLPKFLELTTIKMAWWC